VRDAFGSDWVDTDHDGCNQRDDVLLRDAVPGTTTVAQQGACDHDVLAGTWHDPYTGRTLTFTDLKDLQQAEAIQIDHIVPLAEAWVSGADHWTRDRREAFANDLHELLAVDGPTNMSKGDGDPAAWRPRKGYQCTYARRWIAVKTAWHLAVDPSEKSALEDMLGFCR
jgi:glutathionyl-hydroquinone reductase